MRHDRVSGILVRASDLLLLMVQSKSINKSVDDKVAIEEDNI